MSDEKRNFVYILDSGAFSVWRKGERVDINKYAEFVYANKKTFRGGAFNLDFIDLPERTATWSRGGLNAIVSSHETGGASKSYENWLELRKLGADTIPVHHMGDDEIWLKKYLDQTDYIGIGAVAKLDSARRVHGLDYTWNKYLKNPDGSPRCRVHGLGLTTVDIMLRYPWYSVDSTRAIANAAYGSIMLPTKLGEGMSYADTGQLSVSNQIRDASFGKGDIYFLCSKYRQKLIKEYCEGLGFTLDETLDGRVLNPKMKNRIKKDAEYTGGTLYDLPPSNEGNGQTDMNNLSAHWEARFALNLYVSDQFVRYWRTQGKTIRIYNVVGGGSVFEAFAATVPAINPAARCLVSYARINDTFLNRLREVANGH